MNQQNWERYFSIAMEMFDKEGWEHIQAGYYRYNGDLYDLSNANLDQLDKVIDNTHFLVERGVFKC